MADNNVRSARLRNPIAELARLIGQVHGERARANSERDEETASVGHDNEPPCLPPAPRLSVAPNAPVQAHELDERLLDDEAYDVDDQPGLADEEYQDEENQNEVPRVRRRSLALVMAITGLALLGTAGALGYRDLFGGSVLQKPPPSINVSNEPDTIAPVFRQPQGKNSGNEGKVGTATTGSIENMPAREEQSVTHLAAAPISPANADVTGALTPSTLGRGYAVQVTSERSEARAQAAFRALQAKYPNQLGGRQLIIRRAKLGASGIYYRALVGPFASAEKAAKMCSGLKAAGGDCIIQKN
jgi:hypothetical protein